MMIVPCRAAAARLQLLPRAVLFYRSRSADPSLFRKRPLGSTTRIDDDEDLSGKDDASRLKAMLIGRVMNSYTVLELKDQCRSRGLPVSGRKAELQERLRLDIYADDDDADDDTSSGGEVNDRLAFPVPAPTSVVREIRNEFCFDRASNYKLVPVYTLEREGRMEQDAVLSPAMTVQDETATLLELIPEELASSLTDPAVRSQLMEVVLDVGRRPFAWVNGKRVFLTEDCEYRLTREQLKTVLTNLHFGADNRAGINGSLHRISAIRNRDGVAVGATLRVGRYVPGNAIMIADLLLGSNYSILFVGPPGSAKTSIIRDAARLLADNHSVVIVDTSSEIGGAGDIPHECIGLSRRMQVKHIDVQAAVMVECVQNHTPSVMVIDEIGRPAEVAAALTCKERGVRIIASAHGNMPGLVRNAALCDLVGGIDNVTVGDMTARQDAMQRGEDRNRPPSKLRTERRGPPIFDVIVELQRNRLHEWQIVLNSAAAVDSILSFGQYEAQIRTRTASGTAGSLQIRNVKHNVDRDNIIEEAFKNESSTLHNKIQKYNGEPSYDDYAMDPSCTTCPVCHKSFYNRRGMITHALSKNVCTMRLPHHIRQHFRQMAR
jgi:stage III sporulation protein SpoIIIAA